MADWRPVLTVWSLDPPRAGLTDMAPVPANGGLFRTEFLLPDFGTLDDGSRPVMRARWSVGAGAAAWITPAREISHIYYAVTVGLVVAFAFSDEAGWPGCADFSATTLAMPVEAGLLANASDRCYSEDSGRTARFEASRNAYARLCQAASWPGSFVRLVIACNPVEGAYPANNPENLNRNWWVQYRFPFRVPLIGDAGGQVDPAAEGHIDPRLVAGLGFLTLPAGPSNFPQEIPLAVAEAAGRDAGSRRVPVFMGGLGSARKASGYEPQANIFESFALNAGALQTQNTVGNEDLRFDQPPLEAQAHPTGKSYERWGRTVALGDGFWWAKNKVSGQASDVFRDLEQARWEKLDEAPLTLQSLLAYVPDFPDTPAAGAGKKPVVTALTSVSPAEDGAPVPYAPALWVLSFLGLEAETIGIMPVATVQYGAGRLGPDHYLLTMPHARDNGTGLEWRRWVTLVGDTRVLLRVRQRAWAGDGKQKQVVTVEGLNDAHMLAIWSRLVAEPITSLTQSVYGQRATGLMPVLETSGTGNGLWNVAIEFEEAPERTILGAGQAQPPLVPRLVTGVSLFRLGSSALDAAKIGAPVGGVAWYQVPPPDPGAAADLAPGQVTHLQPVTLDLDLPGFAEQSGRPLQLTATGATINRNRLDFVSAGGRLILTTPHKISFESVGAGSASCISLGAFDLTTASVRQTDTLLSVEVRATDEVAGHHVWTLHKANTGAVEGLRLKKVDIAGADDQNREIAAQSLVWSLAEFARNCQLVAEDAWDADLARRVTQLSIRPSPDEKQANTGQVKAMVFDTEPMGYFAVEMNTLTGSLAESDVIATWNSGERLWRMPRRDGGDRAEAILMMPPQGIGESWERRRKTPGPSDYLPPDQIDTGARVPSRPGPAARLRIEIEERERNPVVPWNLRRLLNDIDTDLPGVRLTAIERLEAFYGLEAWNTPTPKLRLAELSAWRGIPRTVPEKGQGTREPARLDLWRRARRAWMTRLAVLDARMEDDLLARPQIDEVHYRIRPDGAYAPTVPGLAALPAPFGWANGTDGIQGGALSGFEDSSIVLDLLDDAARGEGSIDGLQLSALGAWTRPRANFNNGLTLISADVQMGRTQEARFERKGRIGILRTRAKHVIVYRRTFLPSRQFASDQEPHPGRPIVRKVEEYVEILQPVRGFPETDGGSARESGAVTGARFRTIRIPVHGSWRQPLPGGRRGYQIPLWRIGADEAIYPRPHAEFLVAGDPALAETEPSGRRIVDVEKLVFYTLAAEGGVQPAADTDAWPNIRGIDFDDRPVDSPISPMGPLPTQSDFQQDGTPEATLPPASLVAGGLERFSFILEPGPLANLAMGRSGKTVMADLRSVTLMRATPVKLDPAQVKDSPSKGVADLARTTDAVREEVHRMTRAVADGVPIGEAKARTTAVLKALETTFTDIGDTFKEGAASSCAAIHTVAGQVRSGFDFLSGWTGPGGIIAKARADWSREGRTLVATLADWDGRLAAIEMPSAAVKRQFRAPVSEALKYIDDVHDRIDALKTLPDTWLAGFDKWVKDQIAELQHAAAQIRQTPTDLAPAENVLAALRKYRGDVAATAARVEMLAGRIQNGLQDAAKALEHVSPALRTRLAGLANRAASPIRRFGAALRQAQTEIDQLSALVSMRLESARGKLTNAAQVLAQTLETCAKHLGDDVAPAVDLLAEKARTEVTRILEPVLAALDDAKAKVVDLERQLTWSSADAVAQDTVDRIQRALVDLRAHVANAAAPGALLDSLGNAIDALRHELGLDTIDQTIDGTAGKLCDLANEAAADIADWLKQPADELKKLMCRLPDDLDGIETAMRGALAVIDASADRWSAALQDVIDRAPTPQNLAESPGLQILRAAGAPPIVASLAFNREQVAYFFDETRRIVTTPMTALMDQAQQELRGLGVALPTLGIDETLLGPVADYFTDLGTRAQELENGLTLKARDVLKDFAGMKDLMPSLEFDGALARAVRITHDLDVKTRQAWLQADVDYSPGTTELFTFGGFALRTVKPHLVGQTRYERPASGAETRRTTASLTADWLLELGGTELVCIHDAVASYDGSGLHFDIRPDKVEYNGALKGISEALAIFSAKPSPLSTEIVFEGGRPVGLKSRYDLPPTTMAGGGFNLFNVSMGVHLDLIQTNGEFHIRVFAYFGRQDAPFSMTVGLLGGGGYLEAEATHWPRSGATDITVALSVGACAGTGFSFGPLAGYVQVYLGIRATYSSGNGGTHLAIAAVIVIDGAVTAWGFVTIGLGVTLALTYDGSGAPHGDGEIDVEVRISRFFKKSFSRPIHYSL
jgi:hypothetical protein